MQSSPDAPNLAGLKLQASVHGNIAVKAHPIRLLALCTAIRSPHIRIGCIMFLPLAYCGAQKWPLTALPHENCARLRASRRQGTIAAKISLAGLHSALTGLPQPFCKK
jgi:hypothetical protein